MKAAVRDFTLSIGCALLLAADSACIAFVTNVWVLVVGFAIFVLGSGASVTFRSLNAANVDKASLDRLYAAISAVGTLGGLVGMPAMGAVYEWGISHGFSAFAPPFLLAAVS